MGRGEVSQVQGEPGADSTRRSAFVRIHASDGLSGIGEASPMRGGAASLGIIARDIGPALIGADPLDQAVLQDRLVPALGQLRTGRALPRGRAAIDLSRSGLRGPRRWAPPFPPLAGA